MGEVFGDDVMAAALIDRLVRHCHLVSDELRRRLADLSDFRPAELSHFQPALTRDGSRTVVSAPPALAARPNVVITVLDQTRRAYLRVVDETHSETATPLVWTKGADDMLASIARVAQRTLDFRAPPVIHEPRGQDPRAFHRSVVTR